jgi:hypothetical protein
MEQHRTDSLTYPAVNVCLDEFTNKHFVWTNLAHGTITNLCISWELQTGLPAPGGEG